MKKYRSAVNKLKAACAWLPKHMETASQNVMVRWHVASAMPQAGATTAEYAVVLVAATGFAGLLVSILKSGVVKTLLTTIIQKVLKV